MAHNPRGTRVQYGDMLFDFVDEMKPEEHPIRWFQFQFLIGVKDMLADGVSAIHDFIVGKPDQIYPGQDYFQDKLN